MTQESLAAAAGLSVQMVRTLESEQRPGNPRLTTLPALLDALDTTLSTLLPEVVKEQHAEREG